MSNVEYKLDAANKILGRLATEVVILLRGKNSPAYDPAKFSGNKVVVYNTDKIRVTGRKMAQKLYRKHSGYPGGLKEMKLRDKMARDSRTVVREAVLRMLPKNRLRKRLIKNLVLYK